LTSGYINIVFFFFFLERQICKLKAYISIRDNKNRKTYIKLTVINNDCVVGPSIKNAELFFLGSLGAAPSTLDIVAGCIFSNCDVRRALNVSNLIIS